MLMHYYDAHALLKILENKQQKYWKNQQRSEWGHFINIIIQSKAAIKSAVCNHQHRRTCIARSDRRHGKSVENTQTAQSANAQFGVDN